MPIKSPFVSILSSFAVDSFYMYIQQFIAAVAAFTDFIRYNFFVLFVYLCCLIVVTKKKSATTKNISKSHGHVYSVCCMAAWCLYRHANHTFRSCDCNFLCTAAAAFLPAFCSVHRQSFNASFSLGLRS